MIRELYGNTSSTGFTIDFFRLAGEAARQAFLAAPFFSTFEPVSAITSRNCEVLLLVRLCSITTPKALKNALADSRVKVRYYTDETFHAKFYIVGDVALVGSANLTDAGLNRNRELSVTLRRGDSDGFEALPEIFANLWESADVLTEKILADFQEAYNSPSKPKSSADLDSFLAESVPPCAPPTVIVGSEKTTKERIFLQSFRRRYDEVLVPAITEVDSIFRQIGDRNPTFADTSFEVEISRFLGWLRIKHAAGDKWSAVSLLSEKERYRRISEYLKLWVSADDFGAGDMYSYDQEIANISRIRSTFASTGRIESASGEEIVDALTGCHAFLEQLRFTAGGLDNLKKEFLRMNSVDRIRQTLSYLIFGTGDPVQRAYDCIFDPTYKLHKFAEACVMELLGWTDETRAPINGRTIKALRFLGFDAK